MLRAKITDDVVKRLLSGDETQGNRMSQPSKTLGIWTKDDRTCHSTGLLGAECLADGRVADVSC